MSDLTVHIDVNDMSLRRCSRPDDCGWAEPEDHYTSFHGGQRAIEELMRPYAWPRFHKRGNGGRHVKEFVKPVA